MLQSDKGIADGILQQYVQPFSDGNEARHRRSLHLVLFSTLVVMV